MNKELIEELLDKYFYICNGYEEYQSIENDVFHFEFGEKK